MLPNVSFTFINIIGSGFSILNTITVLIILINHLRRHRDVTLLLLTNTYAAMFAFSTVILVVHIDILMAEIHGVSYSIFRQPTLCILEGYLMYGTFGCCYMTFVVQAAYRLARVVFYKHRVFQTFSFNLVFICLQWIIYYTCFLACFIWPKPLFVFHKLDYYCSVPYEDLGGISYIAIIIYSLPISLVTLIYIRVMWLMRHQAPQFSQTQQSMRARRDLEVARRIVFIIIAMTLPGLPNIGFILMSNICPNLAGSYQMYRIEWMGPVLVTLLLSIALILMTPPLKGIIMSIMTNQRAQVRPIALNTLGQGQMVYSIV